MKCVKCDACEKVVSADYQGNTPPHYLYKTLFITNGGDLDISQVNYQVKHLCLACSGLLFGVLKEKNNDK